MGYLLLKINLLYVFLEALYMYFHNIMGFNMFKTAKSAQNWPFICKNGQKRAKISLFS